MEKPNKYVAIGLALVVIGTVTYNIYGKEITTKGFKRIDGTYFTNRIYGAIIGAIGILIIGYRVYLKNKK